MTKDREPGPKVLVQSGGVAGQPPYVGFTSRPPSNTGSNQGDHTTAYALFQEFCRNLAVKDCVDAASKVMLRYTTMKLQIDGKIDVAIKNKIESEYDKVQDLLQDAVRRMITTADMKIILGNLDDPLKSKTLLALKENNRSIFNKVVSDTSSLYLTLRNKLPYTSFPQEGNILPPSGEGSRVALALENMRTISKDIDGGLDKQDSFAESMKSIFWFPKIPTETLLDPKSSSWITIRGRKYNKGTIPRNNDKEILRIVAARHISDVFACYPEV